MGAALSELPRSTIFGIGCFFDGHTDVDFEIGFAELERDTEWIIQVLTEAGVGKGDLALFTASGFEAPWMTPIARALRHLEVPYVVAETYGWDSRRFSTFLERLPVTVVIGLGPETVTALDDNVTPLSDLLSDVRLVWARDSAMRQLRGMRIAALPLLKLGPTLALGLPDTDGARVNSDEWFTYEQDGEVMISNTRARAAQFNSSRTGVKATVEKVEGRAVIILNQ